MADCSVDLPWPFEKASLPICSPREEYFVFCFCLDASFVLWLLHHTPGDSRSLPMRLAAEVTEIGFAGMTSLLHFPVAAEITHQALAFPMQTLQHHIIHAQVVYSQSLHATCGQVHLGITYRAEDTHLLLLLLLLWQTKGLQVLA